MSLSTSNGVYFIRRFNELCEIKRLHFFAHLYVHCVDSSAHYTHRCSNMLKNRKRNHCSKNLLHMMRLKDPSSCEPFLLNFIFKFRPPFTLNPFSLTFLRASSFILLAFSLLHAISFSQPIICPCLSFSHGWQRKDSRVYWRKTSVGIHTFL